jgi:uncharacterized protein
MFENKKSCEGCEAECCKHVAIEIDAPENLEDFEDIKWYVAHKNINVFVDEDYEWYVEFLTPCEFLGDDFKCTIHGAKPKLCNDYLHDECVFHNSDYEEKYTFKSIEDVENYIEKVFDKGEHVTPDYEEDED